MAEIYKFMWAPSTVSLQFQAYAAGAFQRLAVAHPWNSNSLWPPVAPVVTSSRSGAWIFRSSDQRLILKRISAAEKDTLVAIADDYVAHVTGPQDTLLSLILGCYSYWAGGRTRYFLLMQNCCPPQAPVTAIYDLKGSTSNRSVLADRSFQAGAACPESPASLTRLADPMVALKVSPTPVCGGRSSARARSLSPRLRPSLPPSLRPSLPPSLPPSLGLGLGRVWVSPFPGRRPLCPLTLVCTCMPICCAAPRAGT